MVNQKLPKKKKYESPYSLWETVKWLWKNVRLKKKNPGKIQFIPKITQFNEINPKYHLSFIGDIMDLGHKYLEVSPQVKEFINNSDYLIGNFEATITDEKQVGMDQVHDEKVVDALKKIFPPSKTCLCVANNHSGDFGLKIFKKSLEILFNAGFNVFGEAESITIDLTPNLRLIAGTMWSNRKCDYIANLKDISEKYHKNDAMNILYPHWGYDLELYPRLFIIEKAKKLLMDFDAIIGHHSHCPQPITSVSVKNRELIKLCAYSLGDFCFGRLLTKHFYNYNYGLIIKTEIGTNNENQWAIGNIEWCFTECIKKDSNIMYVELKDTNPYYPNIK